MISEAPADRAVDADDRRTLGRTAAWLAKQVEIGLTTAELSMPQYRVLGLLDERSAVSSDLAERLAVRPPSVTAIVDGLVARGLVERRTVDSDRRRVDHVLTEDGRRSLATADAAVAARLGEIAACLEDPADTRRAFDGLFAWRRAFGAYRLSRSTGR
ncbi:MAG: MarR family winged helix-turn-helix transcriptional regulator [Acidimicrobiales bacterium]